MQTTATTTATGLQLSTARLRDWLRARSGTVAGEPVRRLALVVLSLAGISLVMVTLAVVRGPQLSIVDEPAHAGYLYDFAYGQIPAKGTPIPGEILFEAYCHNQAGGAASVTVGNGADPTADTAGATGVAITGDTAGTTDTVDCSGSAAPSTTASGQVYTFGDPPLYYLATGLPDRLIGLLVPGSHDFISVGRALGAVWLLAAMIALYFAARRFRIGWRYAFSAAALLPLCPGVLASTSEITSDAPASLCGALALYVLAGVLVERRSGFVGPLLATVFTTGTKVISGMPMLIVGFIAFCLAVGALRRRERERAKGLLRLCGGVLAGFALVYVGWSLYQGGRGDPNWINPNLGNGLPLAGSPVGDYLSSTFGIFGHLTMNFWLQPQITGETVNMWAALLGVLFVAGPFLIMVISRSRSWGWSLGLGTLGGITAVTFAVQAQMYIANGEYFASVAPRYALSFLPWAIVCLAVVAHRRQLLRSSVTLVSLGLCVMLLAETGLFTLGPALVKSGSTLVG